MISDVYYMDLFYFGMTKDIFYVFFRIHTVSSRLSIGQAKQSINFSTIVPKKGISLVLLETEGRGHKKFS